MLSFSQTNQLLSGFQGNVLRSGGRNTRKIRGGNQRTPILCEQSLQDTVRTISCLSLAEVQVLAERSMSQWNKVMKSNNLKQVPNIDENISLAFKLLEQNGTRTGGLLNASVLKHKSSPMLVFARGFKTRRDSSSTHDKPFTNMKSNSDLSQGDKEGAINDILKQLDISEKEKEKINIALLSYAAGAAKASKGQDSGSSGGGGGGQGLGATWFGDKNFTKIFRGVYTVLSTLCVIYLCYFVYNSMLTRNSIGSETLPEDIGEITFEDVKGCDEAKQELQEVVAFLTNPEKFSNLGGKLPKGCLLVGPPGTGKTLLARAVAGEAGVPFFHAAGPEFDEMLVGQGARRVRDLFKAAKDKAPCVIFIDEIDSVGSKRTSSALHPYANQTINQLLSEMDGFKANEGVIVLGATNRKDDLDSALLRPGRFDTQVLVVTPDIKGRREILQLYLSKIKHDDSIDIEKLAKLTVGFSGADLQNMVNTAAIRAAIDGKKFVSMAEFEYSHDKATLGVDWKSRVREKSDLEITAYHEAGHTLVAYFTAEAQALHKVTIVAKGQSGGHTAFLPAGDYTSHQTKIQMLASIDVSMGGRAAEELIFGKEKITGGASADLEHATSISTTMVKHLGMSEKIGLRIVQKDEVSPGSTELMDTEITSMLNDSYKRAINILKTHRKELDLLAEALLQYETLDSDDIKAIVENKRPPPAKTVSSPPSSSILKIKPTASNESKGLPPVPGVSSPPEVVG